MEQQLNGKYNPDDSPIHFECQNHELAFCDYFWHETSYKTTKVEEVPVKEGNWVNPQLKVTNQTDMSKIRIYSIDDTSNKIGPIKVKSDNKSAKCEKIEVEYIDKNNEALTISMFSANKLIVIDSTIYLSQKKDIENINLLENYFNNYNSNSYLVFVSNSDTIDSRKKLVKFINSNGTTKKVEANNEYLSDYVNDYLKKKNYKMSSMDINIFINRVGNNIDNIKNELDKLMLYKINDKVINNSDIMLLTEENTDNSVYDLVSALLRNNNSKAIKLYKNFVMNGIDLNQIIAIIASQIRLLFQVKRLYNSGKSNDEIAKILEFKSVYRVKYLLSDSYYYSEDTLIKYLSKLSNIDRDIKINNIDGNILLELFIAGKDY